MEDEKEKKNRIEGHSVGDEIGVQLVYLSHLRCAQITFLILHILCD